jgi:hypothetical protein
LRRRLNKPLLKKEKKQVWQLPELPLVVVIVVVRNQWPTTFGEHLPRRGRFIKVVATMPIQRHDSNNTIQPKHYSATEEAVQRNPILLLLAPTSTINTNSSSNTNIMIMTTRALLLPLCTIAATKVKVSCRIFWVWWNP